MSYYSGYSWDPFGSFEWNDPFPDGIHRKYWDMTYYTEDPKSYDQLKDQKFLGSFFPPLENYHVSKEQEEKFDHIMQLYGLSFSDIKYPYLTSLGSTASAVGSGIRGAVQVSKNITRLYL